MNPAGNYELAVSGAMQERMDELLAFAVELGCVPRMLAALGVIRSRLKLDPQAWGDPFHHYPAADITAYRVLHDELAVEYGVHDYHPIVWLTAVMPVLGHPLRVRDEQGS